MTKKIAVGDAVINRAGTTTKRHVGKVTESTHRFKVVGRNGDGSRWKTLGMTYEELEKYWRRYDD